MVAPTSLLNILISDENGFDHCARGEVIRKIKKQVYWSPYLHAMCSISRTESDKSRFDQSMVET